VDDHAAIIELLARYATIPDGKNWDGVFDVFAESVMWDFESLGAGPAAALTPAEILAWIKPGFTGCLATHHSITNHRITVEGDRASIRAHIRAEHWIDQALVENGQNCWLLVGFYDDEAILTPDGWRLSSVRLTVTFQSGREVMQLAMVEGQRVLSSAANAAGN
jgi:3-phenylpropionate/cinnamic acid dioxygenase small subunit